MTHGRWVLLYQAALTMLLGGESIRPRSLNGLREHRNPVLELAGLVPLGLGWFGLIFSRRRRAN